MIKTCKAFNQSNSSDLKQLALNFVKYTPITPVEVQVPGRSLFHHPWQVKRKAGLNITQAKLAATYVKYSLIINQSSVFIIW